MVFRMEVINVQRSTKLDSFEFICCVKMIDNQHFYIDPR